MPKTNVVYIRAVARIALVALFAMGIAIPQQALSQTIDLTDPDTYPSGFPTTSKAVTAENYSLATTDGGTIQLNMAYCAFYSGDGHLQMYTKTGVIKYTTTSAVSAVSVKTDSLQSSSGQLAVLVGNTTIATQTSLEGNTTYTFAIDEEYQTAGTVISIKSLGSANVRLDQLSFTTTATATRPSAPTISPESGNYALGQTVTIAATDGCDIYYTIDGSAPSLSDSENSSTQKYEEAISLPEGETTVRAIAVDGDGNESDEATATYTITREKATPTFSFGGTSGEYTVEMTNASAFVAPTLSNSSTATPEYSSNNTAVATVDSGDGTLAIVGYGTATITATVAENDDYLAATASYTIHVVDYVETFELLADASSLAAGDILIVASGVSGSVGLACQWETGRKNVDSENADVDDEGFIVAPPSVVARLVVGGKSGAWTLHDGNYYWMATGGSGASNIKNNYLEGSSTLDDCGYASIEINSESHAATVKFADAQCGTLYYNSTSVATPIFSCYNIENEPVYLFRKVERVKIGSHGVSSFCSSNNLDFSRTAATPYVATEVAEGYVTLSPLDVAIPSGTGVMLKGDAGQTVSVPVASTADGVGETNLLRPVLCGETITASTDSEYHNLFGTMDGETAFFKLETDFESNANRCYLATDHDIQPISSTSKGLAMCFRDKTTSATMPTVPTERPKAVYTLSGQRVEAATKPGIYIVDGRKVVVR